MRRNNPLTTLADFAPEGVESGVGLALTGTDGRYLFFLAGTRHPRPPGTLFYAARLTDPPKQLPPDEVRGIVVLTTEQVKRSLERQPTLAELLDKGAGIIAGAESVDRQMRLYPIGAAAALARMLSA